MVTSLMKGKMALTLVAEEANCKHSAKKPCLEGWALRCNLLQMNTRSLQEAVDEVKDIYLRYMLFTQQMFYFLSQ